MTRPHEIETECETCEGSGKIAVPDPDSPMTSTAPCPDCDGKGYYYLNLLDP